MKNEGKTVTYKIRQKILEKFNNKCILCGSTEELHVHHVDKNRKNNNLNNLLLVCEGCHFRFHGKLKVDKSNEGKVIELRRKGMSHPDISKELKIPRSHVHLILSKMTKLDETIENDCWESFKKQVGTEFVKKYIDGNPKYSK